jgi:acetyl-CoA carboxylase biotin carboxyl carrier protein
MARERGERGGEPTPPNPNANLSIAEIRQLITLMNGSDLDEVTIEQEAVGLKLVLRKPAPTVLAGGEVEYDYAEVAETPAEENPRDKLVEVRAEWVGVFRASAKPGGKPVVGVGDVVREGQAVAAIEALNVYNEIEVGTNGRVQEILASDGQPVEYGQVLLVIEPA